jgi:RNA polymerase sigma-70 factor (ECF subfamily)
MDSTKEAQFLNSYKEHTGALFRYCYFKTLNKEEAKDMVQDVFIKTWEYIRNGGEVLNMKAFLYRTAHNIVIDHYRKKKPVSLDNLFEEGFDVSSETDTVKDIENKIDGAEAIKLLNQIPKAYRDVIYMQYVDGLGVKEIADILGESPNNVSVKIHRGLEKIKKIYHKDE